MEIKNNKAFDMETLISQTGSYLGILPPYCHLIINITYITRYALEYVMIVTIIDFRHLPWFFSSTSGYVHCKSHLLYLQLWKKENCGECRKKKTNGGGNVLYRSYRCKLILYYNRLLLMNFLNFIKLY